MKINFDGDTEIVVENPLDLTKKIKTLKNETLIETGFKVVGRIIFNYSQIN